MRRTVAFPLAAAGSVLAMIATAVPASAHGYVSTPPSRQALCAAGSVPDCGQIQFEPQSVEGPKGLRNCSANLPQFAVLDDESRNWPATSVGTPGGLQLGADRPARDEHVAVLRRRPAGRVVRRRRPAAERDRDPLVDLSGFSGRQKILAVWNIADTANAFYNCIDVNIGGSGGGGGGSAPQPTQTSSPAPTQTSAPQPTSDLDVDRALRAGRGGPAGRTGSVTS